MDTMELQVSSGQGPEECELAVGKFIEVLKKEYPGIEVSETNPGRYSGCYRSVRIQSSEDLSFLEGTVQWVCSSPYRKNHKRKNWFIDISLCSKAEKAEYDENLVRFETFRSGGKGGQHVNKVETGVRAIYVPTGTAVVSTDARSQHMNKKIALNRLCESLMMQGVQEEGLHKALNRLEHTRIERGNPVRVYEGIEFKRTK